MRSLAWLSVVILVAVVLSVAFSWFLSSPDRYYLFDGERGITRPEVADWWRIRVPVAFALGTITCGLLIVLLRTARSRAWLEAVACLAVAVLGASTLAGSLFFVRQQADTKPIECVRPTPQTPHEVFNQGQWGNLASLPTPSALVRPKHRLGPLRQQGVGLEGDYRGVIPFDPFLLDRISFVGLTIGEVESLLGPPLPERLTTSSISYLMLGFSIHNGRARLILTTGSFLEPSDTVKSEYLRYR